MRAFTIATDVCRLRARWSRLGQNSVSAITISCGLSAFRYRRTAKPKSSGIKNTRFSPKRWRASAWPVAVVVETKICRSGYCCLQFSNQLAHRQHFAHGNGMHPDGAGLGVIQSGRHKAKALPQSGAIFAQAEHLNGPPWQREQRRAGQKQTVEDIH